MKQSVVMRLFGQKKFQVIVVVVATLLAYSNIFGNEFVIDDRVFILDWEAIRGFNIVEFFKGAVPPGHEGVYRPIRSIFYALYYQLFGTNPFGWHLHSLIVHLLSTVLVYFIVAHIVGRIRNQELALPAARLPAGQGRQGIRAKNDNSLFMIHNSTPFLAAFLFGLHPIHTETITYIASSMDAIGIVFFFAAFYLYLRSERRNPSASLRARAKGERLLSLFFALLAFFTNEMTLILPLLIILTNVILRPRLTRHEEYQSKKKRSFASLRMTKESIPYFVLVGLYALVRIFIAGATTRGPYLADSFYLTMLTMTKVFVKYISLLILPINQANNHAIGKGIEAFVYRDYRTEAIAAQTIFDPQILFSLTVIVGLIVIAIFSFTRRPLVTFSIGWFFISLLPVSEIIPQGSMLNERMLYIPSFGFILLVTSFFLEKLPALLVKAKSEKRKAKSYSVGRKSFEFFAVVFTFALLLFSFFYGHLTFQRNLYWRNEITLWSKDVQVYPTENAYAYYQLGNALVRAGRVDEAIPMYERSNVINTKFVLGLGSIAILYSNAGMTDRAEGMYRKAILVNPTFWEGRFNLGNLYVQQGKLDFALEQYRAVLEINPNFLPAREKLNYIKQVQMPKSK